MAQPFDEAISTLQKLIETCRDGQNGYRDAAEHVDNAELKEFFNRKSIERAQCAGELEQEIQRLGAHDPDRSGSTAGALHRAWFELKDKLGGGDETILNSVEQDEDKAKKDFEEAINKEHIPADIREVIEQVATRVRAAHDEARNLRDRYKKAA